MAKPEKQLLLNGKPFSLAHLRPTFEKLKKFLDAMPDNEVLDSSELCRKSGVGACAVSDHSKKPELAPYIAVLTGRNKRLYGNPRAIKRLKELLTAEAQ